MMMNQRLVWNFEISSENLLNLHQLPHDERDEIRWEARFFWPADQIISLHGLDERFLAISNYQSKHRYDRYKLLVDSHYNIKLRHSELLYKPLLKERGNLRGYGKKINLTDYPEEQPLPGTEQVYSPDLLLQLRENSREIEVVKEALIYKFPCQPTIKLELARLNLEQAIYFSVCIEGRSQSLVTKIANHLIEEGVSCDYVDFIKKKSNAMMNNLPAIAYSFGKIGLISLGGGNSMLKLLEYEAVTYRHWISSEDFVAMVGSSFLFPGLTAVKLSALIGYKAAGMMGLILAVACLNLPGLILAVIGYQFLSASHNPVTKKLMVAVQYGALALLAAASYSVAQGVIGMYFSLPLALSCILFFLALVYFDLSPFWGFIVFIGICFFFVRTN